MIPLRLLNLNRSAVDPQRGYTESWIQKIVDHDTRCGRSAKDFVSEGTEDVVKKTAATMKARGFEVYGGGGNFFYVRYDRLIPIVVHARPLAHRVVKLRFA